MRGWNYSFTTARLHSSCLTKHNRRWRDRAAMQESNRKSDLRASALLAGLSLRSDCFLQPTPHHHQGALPCVDWRPINELSALSFALTALLGPTRANCFCASGTSSALRHRVPIRRIYEQVDLTHKLLHTKIPDVFSERRNTKYRTCRSPSACKMWSWKALDTGYTPPSIDVRRPLPSESNAMMRGRAS